MKTEARKSFDTGFVLTEEELRRIVDVARQQLEKAGVVKVRESFEVKFKNGTISDIGSLDELLSLENVGSKEIVRLDILLAQEPPEGTMLGWVRNPSVGLHFRNVAEDDDPRPISYDLRGTERDWVFVTASELDERIAKIESHVPRKTLRRKSSRPLTSLLFLIGIVFSFFVMSSLLRSPRPRAAETIESQWKAGTLRDPIEAIIIQQKAHERELEVLSPGRFGLVVIGIPVALMIAIELLFALVYYLYPAYVFSWGDKAKFYERRVQIRGYVFGGIVVTLVISVIAGIIANKLTLPR